MISRDRPYPNEREAIEAWMERERTLGLPAAKGAAVRFAPYGLRDAVQSLPSVLLARTMMAVPGMTKPVMPGGW